MAQFKMSDKDYSEYLAKVAKERAARGGGQSKPQANTQNVKTNYNSPYGGSNAIPAGQQRQRDLRAAIKNVNGATKGQTLAEKIVKNRYVKGAVSAERKLSETLNGLAKKPTAQTVKKVGKKVDSSFQKAGSRFNSGEKEARSLAKSMPKTGGDNWASSPANLMSNTLPGGFGKGAYKSTGSPNTLPSSMYAQHSSIPVKKEVGKIRKKKGKK